MANLADIKNKITAQESSVVEKLVLQGDISKLSAQEKVIFYNGFCKRLGLDPFTQPFKILSLSGKQTLYCDRSGVQQLSKLHNVSHSIKSREVVNDCYIVTAQASANGRQTESIGAVSIINLKGDALCNAMMKAETKAKRRATLDLLGLGMLDETEIETIPYATKQELPITEQSKVDDVSVNPQEQPTTTEIMNSIPPITEADIENPVNESISAEIIANSALIVDKIKDVIEKTGDKGGKKWTRYAVLLENDDVKYGTFDKKIADKAKELKGQEAELYYQQDGKYTNLLAIRKTE